MSTTQIVYIHGGEAFDGFWEGAQSYAVNTLSKLYPFKKKKLTKWPDTLPAELGEERVLKLAMPCKYDAKYAAWQRHFESQFDHFEPEVILLGWSLGANFLAKYLTDNQPPFKIKSVHLVAGCFGLGGGFDLSGDFPGRLKSLNVRLYHSQDDFVVDFKDFEKYRTALPNAKTFVFETRNHFLQPQFPELIESLKTESR